MNSALATAVCIAGIAGLLYLDRAKPQRVSKALWLPVVWLLIIGSRPVSVWLGISSAFPSVAEAAEGSPLDAGIFGVLLAAGIMVLIKRRRRVIGCLKANWPCLIYFAYCLLSVIWSDSPGLALKRWIKAIGDLAMVLILVTEIDPEAAFERFISRSGFVLMPASILLIKYFGDLGRGYDPDGNPMNTGVTTYKNSLGVISLVISLGALWYFFNALRAKRTRNRTRARLVRGLLLAFSVTNLIMAHSATAIVCFTVGTILLLATYMPMMKRRRGTVHALVVLILLSAGLAKFLGGEESVVHALGKKADLTGRTAIWAALLPAVPNPVLGAGFESFWLPGPRLERVYNTLSTYEHVNEAHNGYIEVYLNLGWVGVILIAIVLISGYRASVAIFRKHPAFGGLMLAYVAAAACYSISEAGFRMLGPMWMFLLLAVVCSHDIARRDRRRVDDGSVRPPAGRVIDRSTRHVAAFVG